MSPISRLLITIQGRYIETIFTNRLYTCHVQVDKKVSEPSRSYDTGEFPD